MAEQYKILHPSKYYRDHIKHDVRPDGREFGIFRPFMVNIGSISSADGSAIAKIGKTTVVCGIKAELCKPKAETARSGFLIPNVELSPLCSPKFRPGPPSEQAQVYTQIIADILRDSKCLDLESLCIYPDKLCWCLFADLICLDFDGAVIDVCVAALMAALGSVTLPSVEYDAALDNKQVNLEERKPLHIKNIPVSTTFALLENKIIADPTVEEEELCSASVTVVTKDRGLCFVHKPGGGSGISEEQMLHCINESVLRTALVEETIKAALKSV